MLPACATVYRPQLAPDHKPTPPSLAEDLKASVTKLASDIGERNCYRLGNLERAGSWIEEQFAAAGLRTRRVPVEVVRRCGVGLDAMTVDNIEAVKLGASRPDEVLIVGAHYDTKVAMPGWRDRFPPLEDQQGTPGANDNASGVAAAIALARMLADTRTERTIRFVAFVNEEPPFYQTDAMGSLAYARSCAADETIRVVGMVSLETLGCYSVRPRKKRSRLAGLLGLPDRPDYVAFLSNRGSRRFSRQCARVFRRHSPIYARAFALPAFCKIVAWSDDWSFWRQGVPAFAVTDTAYLRCDDYHELSDRADRLDYAEMADVVWGLRYVVEDLASPELTAVDDR